MKVEINVMKLQEVNFQKSQKLLASRAGSSKKTIACTAFTQPAIEIEYLLNVFNRPRPWSSLGEQYLEWIFINLLRNAAFSHTLQTSENNLKPP